MNVKVQSFYVRVPQSVCKLTADLGNAAMKRLVFEGCI